MDRVRLPAEALCGDFIKVAKLFSEKNGHMIMDGIDLVDLASRYGTPLLVTSERRLQENCAAVREAFNGAFADCSFKYAVKANPNPKIISLIAGEGFGADASSPAEIEFALAAGIAPEEIMFSPNYASADELLFALKKGVVINLDDISQLGAFGKRVPGILSFRLNPGFGSGGFAGIVTAGPKAKFGMPPWAIVSAYRKAKRLGVRRFGIHMMTGSNVLDYRYFGRATRALMGFAGMIAAKAGVDFEFIDIGGGFGVPYSRGEDALDIKKAARLVASEFSRGIERYPIGSPRLMMEPGRYIVADTTVLLGRINNVKRYSRKFVGTDVGMDLLLRPALYGAYHEVVVANKIGIGPSERVSLTGEICENTDIMAHGRMLPRTKPGDVIAFFDAGAYVYGMSSNYNGRLRPAEVLVRRSGKSEVIRRRETTSDLFATLGGRSAP